MHVYIDQVNEAVTKFQIICNGIFIYQSSKTNKKKYILLLGMFSPLFSLN